MAVFDSPTPGDIELLALDFALSRMVDSGTGGMAPLNKD